MLLNKKKYRAFTLAEILITLSILGVIATITIPNVIHKYQKRVVEIKLVKFYNNINKVFEMYAIEKGYTLDITNKNIVTIFNELSPYLEYKSYEMSSSGKAILIYFKNKSLLIINKGTGAGELGFTFYPNGKYEKNTRNYFMFEYMNNRSSNNKYKTAVEPYVFEWNGTIQHLQSHPTYGCRKDSTTINYCTKLIQLNGWKISEDYPW